MRWWQYALAAACGAMCPLVLLFVAYWWYFLRGKNTGWPS